MVEKQISKLIRKLRWAFFQQVWPIMSLVRRMLDDLSAGMDTACGRSTVWMSRAAVETDAFLIDYWQSVQKYDRVAACS